MGFKLNINTILRLDITDELKEGEEYPFEKKELCILADDIQIWLAKKDWTAVAEIQVTSQARNLGKTVGTFVIKHLYTPQESKHVTQIFTRMYGWK